MKNNLLALAAALVGGVLGHLVFLWVARQGFYMLILPGALVGIGAGFFRSRAVGVSIACGLLGLAVGLFSEWRFAPFKQDSGAAYFLSHIHQLHVITLIMIAAGGVLGFWMPFRSRAEALR